MKMRLPIILIAIFAVMAMPLAGQNYTMDGTSITDCNGTFYDPGGSTGNYSDNQNLTTTICSDGTAGTHIRLSFSGADIAPGDALCFYDGQNLAAPLLSCQTDYNPGQPFLIQATAVNPTGCLTVSFVSNSSGTGTGWAAAISCVPSCQSILADLVSTNPAAVPVDTGWIDICPGERVFFAGKGEYLQNNFAYQQSDLTTTFEWNFGDGGIAYGPNTSHRFDQPGGYYVQLALTDQQGCRNTNLINQRIRVAAKPNFQLTGMLDQSICAGDTVALSANVAGNGNNQTLLVTPNASSFAVEGSRSDSLALPDGTGIPYETTIFFTEFSPGQVLVSPTDLESICVDMEHSWARDVEISLTCPNGQSIILHDHPGNFGGQVFLGEPNDNDNVNPIPGLGYDYCWVNNAPNPTWIEYANTVLGGNGTIPSGDYSTFNPIADLVGCPLNGEWSIRVTDWWPIDNGFIFNWSLKFLDELYPNVESFTPALTSWNWNSHPSIFFQTVDSIAAAPQNAGTAGYTFTVNDAFGCSWDTLLTVSVLPPTHPDCFSCGANLAILHDTTICSGGSAVLNATPVAPPFQEVRFESYPDYRIGNGNHPHNNPYHAPIEISSLGYPIITNPTQQIISVCMDIETDYCSDLNIFLEAPSGQLLELTSGNGGSGDNYKTTCFSPVATTSIVGQTAPFNGTYKPEGNWNTLLGAAVNGDWSLRVSDGFAPNQFGKVKWWSIGFKVNNNVSYAWENGATLSCSNCPNPTATPTQSTTYTINTVDAFGCQHHDTVDVHVISFFPAPTGLAVLNIGNGNMVWGWNGVQGALGYEVRVNGGAWETANGVLMHTVNGLTIGQTVLLEVRAVSPGCTPLIAQSSSTYGSCSLVANLDSTTPVLCAGEASGSALISVLGGNLPLQFSVDNFPGSFPNGNLLQLLPAGNHTVVVHDVVGCADTVFFNIGAPPALQIDLVVEQVPCHGEQGSAGFTASGGSGNINFLWEPCQGGVQQSGNTATGLTAGCYALTATDGNGCETTQTFTLTDPDAIGFLGSQSPVSCFGGNDGTATMSVSGGTPPYQFLWENGQTTTTATGFTAGFHFVTVTDANLCQAATFVQITQATLLQVSSTDILPVSCFGGNNGAVTLHLMGGNSPYFYQWNNGQTTASVQNIVAGQYSVTVTDTKGCSAQANPVVASPAALIASFTSVSNDPCAGSCQGQATLQASGGTAPYTYIWSNPAIPAGTPMATGLCPGAYSVTVQDIRGCSNTLMTNIGSASNIQVPFSPTAPTCAGLSNGSITTTVSGGSMPYQYLWDNGSNGPSLQNIACGNHSLTVTDALGCSQVATITLDCPTIILINSVATMPVQCFGGSTGTATVYPTGGVPPLIYQWSDSNAQKTQQATNLASGIYFVTVTDSNGCTASTSTTVSQPSILTSPVVLNHVNCYGGTTGSILANPAGGTAPYLFHWSTGGNGQQLTDIPAGTYSLTVTDANQCSITLSTTITQPAQPLQTTAAQIQAACFGEKNGQAMAVASGGSGAPFAFLWSNGQPTSLANNLAPGIYSVTATDQLGCTATNSVTIQELDIIVVNVAFVPPSCFGVADAQAAVNLITGGAGMGNTQLYHFQWSVPGAPDAPVINGLLGNASYSVTVADLQGCRSVFSFTVNQPPAIVLNTSTSNISCFGGNNGVAGVTNILNANQPVNYLWSNGQTSAEISGIQAGLYGVTVSDNEGCKATRSIEILEPDALKVVFDQQPLKCYADSNATLGAWVTGGTVGYQYQWSNGDTSPNLTNLGPGDYRITVTDSNGCVVTGANNIEQPEALTLTSQHILPDCFGAQNGRILSMTNGGEYPYRYSLNGSEFGGDGTFIALKAGVYALRVRDANGCFAFLNDTLWQPPAVQVTLFGDSSIVFGDSLLIQAAVSNAIGTPSFQWSSAFNDSLTCTDIDYCEEILVKPTLSNTYRLTVTDDRGCTGKSALYIRVNKPRGVYVPTAFSPNNDLTNDLLVVHGISKQVRQIVTFKIFDRWGEQIYEDQNFEVNQPDRGWDGQFLGQPSDPGVYVWLLEAEYLDGHREKLKGDVTLVR